MGRTRRISAKNDKAQAVPNEESQKFTAISNLYIRIPDAMAALNRGTISFLHFIHGILPGLKVSRTSAFAFNILILLKFFILTIWHGLCQREGRH